MNNEPVAWTDGYHVCPEIGYETRITTEHPKDLGWQPLYTHPAKTLTDEEIESIWAEMSEQCDEEFIDMKQFARAILKKASEK